MTDPSNEDSSSKEDATAAPDDKGNTSASGGASSKAKDPKRLVRFALVAVSAIIAPLGFAGFDVWPLAFVAFAPFLAALELEPKPTSKKALFLGWLFGIPAWCGGYYWLTNTLEDFSGFPMWAVLGIAFIFWTYQGFQYALFAWLYRRARLRGLSVMTAAVLTFCATEVFYPHLFPSFYGNSLHMLPIMIQISDLMGPLLVSAVLMLCSVAVFTLARDLIGKRSIERMPPIVAIASVLLTLGYGAYRISEVEGRAAESPAIKVGLVQANMGIFEKRRDRMEGKRRHIDGTLALQREHQPDLIVWPESSSVRAIPEGMNNVRRVLSEEINTPLLFGGISVRGDVMDRKLYNTAFLVDGEGEITSTYDKTYLLAFGEYMPFGDVFPALYEISANTGHFTAGSHVRPLLLGDHRISTLVCYEDVLPSFTREAVNEADPHLLINITNDAWFGDTNEPWVHLALAKFRAVEHHRYLVRSTNSGVSAIVDATGKVLGNTGVFTKENLHGEVRMMTSRTLYEIVGPWPSYAVVLLALFFAFIKKPLGEDADEPSETDEAEASAA